MSTESNETMTVASDVGGTHMRAALISDDGEVLYRRVLPTPHRSKAPTQLTDLIRSVATHKIPGRAPASKVVIGLPGQVDYRSGKLLWAPHLPEAWPKQLSEAQLGKVIGLPVRLANDADIAAVGEAYFGSGRDYRDVGYITISTGVGAGVVFDGRLVHGDRSLAELGHTVIDLEGWQAHRPATLEDMASGTGLSRMADEAGLSALPGEKINELDHEGDPEAIRIWDTAFAAAAVGITNLIMAYSPEVVVLGGGLGLQQNFFDSVRATLERRSAPHMTPVAVMLAALGDSAGLVGAARWERAIA